MTTRRIIAVIGQAKCGKGVLAKRLEAAGFTRHRFNDPVRAMLEALNIPPERLNGPLRAQGMPRLYSRTPQQLIRLLAEWGRNNIDPGIWIDRWESGLETMTGDIVVDDILRTFEVEAARRQGAAIVRVVRPKVEGVTNKQAMDLAAYPADVELLNDGTQAEFEWQIDRLMTALNQI